MLIPDDNGKIQKQLEKNTRLAFSSMDLKNKIFPKYRPRRLANKRSFLIFLKNYCIIYIESEKQILSENLKKGGAHIVLELN